MCPNVPVIHFLCQIVTLNGIFHWSVVGQYLFNDFILRGAVVTIVLAILSQVVGSLIGLLLYFMVRARFAPFRWLAFGYIWLFRGTPLLLQLYIVDAYAAVSGLYHLIERADFLPAIGFTNVILALFVEVWVALSLNEGAYMAEIVRAGIDSIDAGQMEAAKSLGMTYFMAMRRIIIPQAARTIVPPLGNEFNSMMKNTSLASAIALWELSEAGKLLGTPTFQILELLVVAAIWYLVMTTIWTIIQAQIERRLNVSVYDTGPTGPGGFWSRLLGFGKRDTRVGIPGLEVGAGLPAEHRA
jgi:polar amino acid transport system permease protein